MSPATDVLATLDGVRLTYGEHVAGHDIDLELGRGEVVALVGGDGAGKTTVLRLLAGRLRPRSGRFQLTPGAAVGVVPATGATWQDLSVAENLEFVRSAHGSDRGHAEELLERMELARVRDRLAGHLSGGMRQKLALAMALQHRPDLLVLDEPTTGVDPVSRAEIWRLLGQEVAAGAGVVLATTYLDEAARATRTVVMDAGHVLASGPPAEVVANTPGTVVRADERLGPNSWRRGRWWHTWLEDRQVVAAVTAHGAEVVGPDLEDAAIVAALRHEAAQSSRAPGSAA